ncbi:putative bacteriophage coat protein [Yersinia massiliensis]|uniref:hypothetical protein n=1 Tax=Yersinia massiliensis TaxID=419257 RepID=UPI0005E53F84|nr:hypothetical protein [Yersinia massiliensis]CNH58100.1 putative bacteriophage coat protein [Yersinia massiliensis]
MADKYNVNGIPPQRRITQSLDNIALWQGRLNIPYTIASEAAGIIIEDAQHAGTLENAARSVNAPVDQFSQISGAIRILGTEKMAAIKSTEQLYSTLNNMLWGRDDEGITQLHDFGLDIIRNENGTANVPATMTSIASNFSQMAPKNQSKLIEALGGVDNNAIELLREGVRLNDLLAKSTRFGLTVDPKINTQLAELNRQSNELSAAWDGLLEKGSKVGYQILLSDGSIADGIGGLTDLLTYGLDDFAIMRSLGVISGADSEKMRWAYNEPDFNRKLNWYEQSMLKSGLMTDGFRQKYQDYIESKKTEEVIYRDEDASVISGFQSVNKSTDLLAPTPDSLWPSSVISPAGVDAMTNSPINALPLITESTAGLNTSVITDVSTTHDISAIADVIATAMQNNRVQIELTLIDGRSGESSVIRGQGGGRISYAMDIPQ